MKISRNSANTAIVCSILTIMIILFAATMRLASSTEVLPKITIHADGSLEPSNVPIRRDGNVYTFTDNIQATLVVSRDSVVIDGAGFTLKGTYNGTRTDSWVVGKGPDQAPSNGTIWTIGVDSDVATKPNNMTIKNLTIEGFYIGVYLWTSNHTLAENAITDNIVGVLLSGDSNNITQNYVARNDQGIFFGVNTPGNEPLNIVVAHNSFVNNTVQFSGCFCETFNEEEAVHTWDDGERGNYWSDYNGTDTNSDGVGDTPYTIDQLNLDRYPLMQSLANPFETAQQTPVEVLIVAFTIVALVAAVAAVVVFLRRGNSVKAQIKPE